MANTQFQPKEYARFRVNSTQTLKVYVDRFVDLGLVRKEDTSGKAVYYRTTGDVNLYFNKEQGMRKPNNSN